MREVLQRKNTTLIPSPSVTIETGGHYFYDKMFFI